MYNYETMKPEIFTDQGQKTLIQIIKNIQLWKSQNKDKMNINAMIKNCYGNSWLMLACVDYLEELGEIRLIEKGQMTQFNVYSV